MLSGGQVLNCPNGTVYSEVFWFCFFFLWGFFNFYFCRFFLLISVSSILTGFRQMSKKEGQRCPMGLRFTEKDVDSKNQENKNATLILTMNQQNLMQV